MLVAMDGRLGISNYRISSFPMLALVVRLIFISMDLLMGTWDMMSSSNFTLGSTFDRRKPLFIDQSGLDHLSKVTEFETYFLSLLFNQFMFYHALSFG